jgi:hypothetical protein
MPPSSCAAGFGYKKGQRHVACLYPQTGYRSRKPDPISGKYSLTFSPKEGFHGTAFTVPCGNCVNCRLEYARQWSARIMHEASLWENNIFLTLTYKPEKLPPWGGLQKKDFQDFMKRFRKFHCGLQPQRWEKKDGSIHVSRPIRYFHCGEYGSLTRRPHYHAIIFNFDFRDKYQFKVSKCGNYPIYRSPELERLWDLGISEIGSVTTESAGYVARYCLKKSDPLNEDPLFRWDPDTGEYTYVEKEYVTMSRMPGIGKGWLNKWKEDVYPHDYIVLDGKKWKPPRYYDKQLPEKELELLKERRNSHAKANIDLLDQTPARRRDKAQVADEIKKRLTRGL